jgi:hypothetical protein
MPTQKNPLYHAARKKNPTPEEIMHDIRIVASRNGVYLKLKDNDVASDYYWETCIRVRKQSYYYGLRMESLAYRYLRAKRTHRMRAVA